MSGEQAKQGVVERSAGFLKRLNYAIGAVAVGGALLFESAGLAAFGALQFAEGAVWSWLEKRRGAKQASGMKMAGAHG
jgi:hypothetical protein